LGEEWMNPAIKQVEKGIKVLADKMKPFISKLERNLNPAVSLISSYFVGIKAPLTQFAQKFKDVVSHLIPRP
jgi:hypothetical protein